MKDLDMPGLREDSVHRSYDDVARELREAASRVSAPRPSPRSTAASMWRGRCASNTTS